MAGLAALFSETLERIGIKSAQYPYFYHAPIGIRFEIGGEEIPVYRGKRGGVNAAYVSSALYRAKTLYDHLPNRPNLLRIDVYPNEKNDVFHKMTAICKAAKMPEADEQKAESFCREDETIEQIQLYWQLNSRSFCPQTILHEIIRADIGGYPGFASAVFFADTCGKVIYHVYDDRGADLVAADREILRPIYQQFNAWILDYDREKIDQIFAG